MRGRQIIGRAAETQHHCDAFKKLKLVPLLLPASHPLPPHDIIRPQSSMSKHTPFCGILGHPFMEFLKVSGNYCQAQHDLYADK
ncbi:uncharacterized protein ACOB6Z_017523 [Ctenodactylus gundi]